MTEPAPQYHSLAGAMPIRLATVTEAQWTSTAEAFAAAGNPLVALWGSDRSSVAEGFVVWASYATHDGLAIVRLQVQGAPPEYPTLKCYPSATRMQRALFDLLGVRARDAADRLQVPIRELVQLPPADRVIGGCRFWFCRHPGRGDQAQPSLIWPQQGRAPSGSIRHATGRTDAAGATWDRWTARLALVQ